MIDIAVCDNDIMITVEMQRLLMKASRENFFAVKIDVFWNERELLEAINKNVHYDVIFMETEMKSINGINIAQELRKRDNSALLVFVSQQEKYWKEMLNLRAFNFIKKPIDSNEFDRIMKECAKHLNEIREHYEFVYKKNKYKAIISEIIYIESDKRTLYIVGKNYKRKHYGKLGDIETILKKSKCTFLRIHQSYLINANHLTKMSVSEVELSDGTILAISLDKQKKIKEDFCGFLGSTRIQ